MSQALIMLLVKTYMQHPHLLSEIKGIFARHGVTVEDEAEARRVLAKDPNAYRVVLPPAVIPPVVEPPLVPPVGPQAIYDVVFTHLPTAEDLAPYQPVDQVWALKVGGVWRVLKPQGFLDSSWTLLSSVAAASVIE